MNLELIWAGIQEALQADDDVALKKSADELWGLVVEEGWIPDDALDRFARLLGEEDLLEAPRSRSIFGAIELMWKELQEEQPVRLLPVLEAAFPRVGLTGCRLMLGVLWSRSEAQSLTALPGLVPSIHEQHSRTP